MDLAQTRWPFSRTTTSLFALATLAPVLLYVTLKHCQHRRRPSSPQQRPSNRVKDTAKDSAKVKAELSVEKIKRIIEAMPYEPKPGDSNLSLKDLLAELRDVSDDEEWHKLIESAQSFYAQGAEEQAGGGGRECKVAGEQGGEEEKVEVEQRTEDLISNPFYLLQLMQL